MSEGTIKTENQPVVTDQKENAEVDYQAQLATKDAEIAKLAEEKENYRKGMLIAKGKLPDEDAQGSIELMRQIAREEALSVRETQLAAEKDALIKKMAKDLSEAKLALKNKGQVNNGSQGSHTEENVVVKDNMLSEAQIKSFKDQGKSEAWIERFKQNLSKNKR